MGEEKLFPGSVDHAARHEGFIIQREEYLLKNVRHAEFRDQGVKARYGFQVALLFLQALYS